MSLTKAFSCLAALAMIKLTAGKKQMTTQRGREGQNMGKHPNYFIVETSALPEIFLKVADTKRLLESGEVKTVHEAVRATGISRSAFYKYKDSLRPFQDMLRGRIITFQIILKDEPGVLSAVLNAFAASGANILTINQSIPADGRAAVSIGAETSDLETTVDALVDTVGGVRGVLRCEILGA